MDHRRIEEENFAELYATGRLSPAEEEDFEVHLLECRECRERVARADDLRESVRTVAAEDAARATLQAGLLTWLARRSRAARLGMLGMLMAALALAALPAWLLLDRARLESELAAARKAAERPAPPLPSPAPDPGQGVLERERIAQEKSRLEEELRRERAAREGLAERITRLTRPQVNAAVYSLGMVRGASAANEVTLGPAPEWIVLSLELDQTEHGSYRATLLDARDARRQEIWRGEGLHPTASDTLNVLLYSDLLPPGEYRFRLEGLADGNRFVPAGEVSFRVHGAP